MSEKRIQHSVNVTRMIDEHRDKCKDKSGKCVNWGCDGTRHRDIEGNKWGDGWSRNLSSENP